MMSSDGQPQDIPTGELSRPNEHGSTKAGGSWHETVETAVEQSGATPLTILFIDVNHFKDINDSLGHEMGDRVIEDIKTIITDQLRVHTPRPEGERDIIAVTRLDESKADEYIPGHIGGDEYAILCKTDDIGARILVERLRGAIQNYTEDPANSNLKELDISLAIGVAVLQPGMTARELLAAADQDMYEDKLRQLPPLTEEQEKLLTEYFQKLEENKIRIRDLGNYALRISRGRDS